MMVTQDGRRPAAEDTFGREEEVEADEDACTSGWVQVGLSRPVSRQILRRPDTTNLQSLLPLCKAE